MLLNVTMYCSVLQSVVFCCSVLQCVAVCCSVLQCVAVCCRGYDHRLTCQISSRPSRHSHYSHVRQCVAVSYSVLQCVTVCHNVSQCVANMCPTPHPLTLPPPLLNPPPPFQKTFSNSHSLTFTNFVAGAVAQLFRPMIEEGKYGLQCVVVCCSAVCCSVLQCVAGTWEKRVRTCCVSENAALFWPCVAVCCRVVQCGAVLQCVAVCCSVLQFVVVCCSVFPYVAVCCRPFPKIQSSLAVKTALPCAATIKHPHERTCN